MTDTEQVPPAQELVHQENPDDMEEEAQKLREMQEAAEKEMLGDAAAAAQNEVDARSIYVGNVSFFMYNFISAKEENTSY